VLNCLITCLVVLAKKYDIYIAFSPQGHGLFGLLVSFLVINKMYLALDRYMLVRSSLGHAFSNLRELNQLAIVFTAQQKDSAAIAWRNGVRGKIVDILDSTIRVMKDDEQAAYLSRNECEKSVAALGDDPMMFAQSLRSHLYCSSGALNRQLELLEKVKLVDMLNAYLYAYRDLLKIASTPLPFPMGRTFLFIWIFSMPLALVGLEFELSAVVIFVFFLTYGYVGLELVGMRLLCPFGDDINDLNVDGMKMATIVGIEKDCLVGAVEEQYQTSRTTATTVIRTGNQVDANYHNIDQTAGSYDMPQTGGHASSGFYDA
jgi:predicted membrane chloride channel (bestrophin family)